MPVIVVHAGAGAWSRDREDEVHAALREALEAGGAVLARRGRALDAVQAAVEVLAAEAREALRECGAIRLAVETWRPGDTGDAVIERARVSVATQAEPTR